jgi:uncharacterized protein YecA (UPF0149 family)|tara:strand:- start:4785 stop:5564 length:780 start_codon:yes stop_codon:yes gene_type:complete
MAKYQNEYRQDIGETEINESVMQQAPAEPEPTDPEEATFKKRYGDLRRHMQQQMAERDARLQAMEQQLATATKQQIKFPKSEAEVAEWAKKYPDVANIVDTIAQKRVQEALAVGEQKLEEVKNFERQVRREKAEAELRQTHPDFDTIRASKQFHDWVVEQPQYVQDALYKNNTDARAASRAIDLYKADKGIKKRRAKNTGNAAQAVGMPTSTPPSTGGMKFKESQVARMNAAEYEQNEKAIMEAVRAGNFEYDISQATN